VNQDQSELKDIFENKPPPASPFWSWLNRFATRIKLKGWKNYRGDFGDVDQDQEAYFTVWKGIEIMFHVAPLMDPEGHRRLIGNDICVAIYYDHSQLKPFVPTPIDALGSVPQVFAVVQPHESLYRFGFFSRQSIKPFTPEAPPFDYEFDISNLKDFLLTKLHNGLVMAFNCPPMNRLFSTPRAATIKDLGVNFPKEK